MGPRSLLDHSRLGIKGSKTKSLPSNVLILQIEPTFPPCTDGVKHLQIKVRFGVPNGHTHLPYSVLRVRPLYTKEVLPEPPMGIDPQESLTMGNKASNVQNPIGSQIVQLKPIGV